ncbi:unnamed protein product [Trichogramma brassicae]|uniref:Uncharacterized protein n=1 Tax=Trichogramma brassicae TaxID=86971 RepID=A0A6H5HX56_9HYME|nr:unnamed protein product [Trichogramma brassicae]
MFRCHGPSSTAAVKMKETLRTHRSKITRVNFQISEKFFAPKLSIGFSRNRFATSARTRSWKCKKSRLAKADVQYNRFERSSAAALMIRTWSIFELTVYTQSAIGALQQDAITRRTFNPSSRERECLVVRRDPRAVSVESIARFDQEPIKKSQRASLLTRPCHALPARFEVLSMPRHIFGRMTRRVERASGIRVHECSQLPTCLIALSQQNYIYLISYSKKMNLNIEGISAAQLRGIHRHLFREPTTTAEVAQLRNLNKKMTSEQLGQHQQHHQQYNKYNSHRGRARTTTASSGGARAYSRARALARTNGHGRRRSARRWGLRRVRGKAEQPISLVCFDTRFVVQQQRRLPDEDDTPQTLGITYVRLFLPSSAGVSSST